jgi:cyclopropane fatty-acyl-phospholipid synthase-like methyltransferase
MSDKAAIAKAQRDFWNSEATRPWVTEQARINRLLAEATEAALSAAAPMPRESVLDVGCGAGTTTLRWPKR